MHSSNPAIYSPNSNAGIRFMVEDYHVNNSNTGGYWDHFLDKSTNRFEFYADSTRVLSLFPNGNGDMSGSLTQNSDERVKKDIADLDSAEQSVAQVLKGKIKKFRRTDKDDQKLRFGVIAQEVESAFSDAGLNVADYSIVTETKNYAKIDSNGKFTEVVGAGYPETNLDIRKKVTLNDGTEYIGATNDHTDLDEADQAGESFEIHQTLIIQEGDEDHVIIENSDIKTTEILPPVGYEEVMLKSVDYNQLNAFIISAL
jgi:outer membrane receptor protein involved in Fe transport